PPPPRPMAAGRRRSPPGPCCPPGAAVPGVRQSLAEMDFETGEGAPAGHRLPGGGEAAQPPRCPPQHYASRNGHLGVCRLLLQRGARCDARTPGGATALHRACYCGHLPVVRLLLEHGADPSAADGDGRTGLHKAAECGHRDVCALLLQLDPTLAAARDARGRRPCDTADPALRDLLDG
uniref:Ankyrin repeat domain 39 n=1 Tax=Anas zonorhyncha TaxID=75864 RepID=A0A8B9VDP1_9AVES